MYSSTVIYVAVVGALLISSVSVNVPQASGIPSSTRQWRQHWPCTTQKSWFVDPLPSSQSKSCSAKVAYLRLGVMGDRGERQCVVHGY